MTTQQIEKISELISPTLDDMGYEIVRIQIMSNDDRTTLQIMAEQSESGQMHMEDCTNVSQAVSAILDVEDPISGAYNLEVSSPGLDRPLTRLKDYRRFAGFAAKVELENPIASGQKNFKGAIVSVEGDDVKLYTSEGEVSFSFCDILKAKLILTDELIKAAENKEL